LRGEAVALLADLAADVGRDRLAVDDLCRHARSALLREAAFCHGRLCVNEGVPLPN
jgi:hypothetical protein